MTNKDYEFSYRCKPVNEKGGDGIFFFDFEQMFNLEGRLRSAIAAQKSSTYIEGLQASRQRTGVLLVDVQGHCAQAHHHLCGIEAAWKTALRYELDFNGHITSEAMTKTNRHLLDYNKTGGQVHATATYMEFNPSGNVRFIRAGHAPPKVYRNAPITIGVAGAQTGLLGAFSFGEQIDTQFSMQGPETEQYSMEAGDILLMYTDGLTDVGVPQVSGFQQVVDGFIESQEQNVPLDVIAAGIEERAMDFGPQSDDMTYLLARRI